MKKYISLAIAAILLFGVDANAYAFKKESFVSYNVPVESGQEATTIQTIDLIVKEATFSANTITFYLDYETVKTASMAAYFKEIITEYPYHRLGLWTKVGKTLLMDSTPYEGDKSVSIESKKNLSGYAPSDRHKLIDQMASEYMKAFGNYPNTILDDYVDSASAGYWSGHYGVIGALETYGELGLKMSVSDGKNNGWFNRYFPYLVSKHNGMVPGRSREMSLRLVATPGFTLEMNPNLTLDLPDITNKQLSELTHLALVSPITKQSPSEIRTWVKNYRDLADKYTLRWTNQDMFSDLFLARYPYYTPAFSRVLNVNDKKYWLVFNKDYFSVLNLTDETISNLSLFDDNKPESYWFEYNKQPELVLGTSNIANEQKTGIGTNFKQETEYSRTWVSDGKSKVDFSPDEVKFVPQIDFGSISENVVIKTEDGMTTVTVTQKQNFLYWPFVVLGVILASVYVLQNRK